MIRPYFAAAVFNSGCACSETETYRPVTHEELEQLECPI